MGLLKSTLFLLLFHFLINQQGISQELRSAGNKNTFYAEFSLEGPVYSINYDRIFARSSRLNYSFRIGFSALKDQLALPLGVNLFTGKKNHHAEFTLTATPLIEKHQSSAGAVSDTDSFLYLLPGAGYRFQKSSGGLFIRAIAGPMIILDPRSDDFWKMDPRVRFSFSLGLGYSFGK